LLLMPWVAHAAGLGKLTILSALGQPLLAEIDLLSVQKDELSTLTARIAAPEAFKQANIQYSPVLVGVRLSIERRADGTPYLKIISTRSVNEPFIDLLVELSWAQGRLLREYTALIDPPGFAAPAPAPLAPAAPSVAVTPPDVPASTPVTPAPPSAAAAPVEAEPAAKAPSAAVAPTTAEGKEYAVKRGDTLSKIAAGFKPEGVTLEQMLVSLYRTNPDAFVGNMNRLKTGKILRVPEKEPVAETSHSDAVKEVRVQAANWHAYREKLAEAAGQTPAQETKSAARGKIATTVDDRAAGKAAPKEVLKLSKGEPAAPGKAAGGKPMSTKERLRMLEEEVVAREKSLAEANDRVAQLEKTIKDMQRLLEIKGQVPGAKPAPQPAPQPAPGAKPGSPAKTDQVAKADAAKALPAKAEPAKAEPAKDAAKAPAEAPKMDQKAAPAEKPVAVEPPKAEAPKAVPEAPQPKPKPQPTKIVQAPPAPDLIDEILGEPLYLAGGGGLLALLGAGGYLFVRRRRAQVGGGEEKGEKTAPKLGKTAAATAAATAAPAASPMTAAPAAGADDVDPLAEADLYLNFGRDAQAEEVLKEALGKNPKNEGAQLRLLQIYAGRKDKVAFEKIARSLNTQTGGAGDNWLKAAAMGYAFDPENALYAAGKSAPVAAMPAAGGAAAATDLDFDLELAPGASATKTDVELDDGATDKTMILEPGALAGMGAGLDVTTAVQDITADSGVVRVAAESAAAPDIDLGAPDQESAKASVTGDAAAPAPMAGVIDFNFDAIAPAPADEGKGLMQDGTVIMSPEQDKATAGFGIDFDLGATAEAAPGAKPAEPASAVTPLEADFKLDLGGGSAAAPAVPVMPEFKLDDINLNLEDSTKPVVTTTAEGGAKDDRWYDVQTKFDLAKAYQEMGDKDGAREILQEVIKEGDAGQQAEAKQLLDSLG
jgi:pilus assembly protein FimV